ncbi:MAG: hypothetical protein J6V25_12995 [Oscillospiraceae bacterium]|nr:hypothetical protein [Oscillospiraceae bacterium]
MDWKVVLPVLLTCMLIFSVFAGCTQQSEEVEAVRTMVENLPAVEEFQAMDADAQKDAYDRTQAAYDAYMKLSAGQRRKIKGADAVFASLFAYFNNQIMQLA